MASNDKHKMEEEAESSMVRKCMWHTNDDGGDDDNDSSDSSNSPEEEPEEVEEEVSSEEMSMNQLDTSEEKLYARRTHGYPYGDDGDTTSMLPNTPPTLESRWCSDEESSDDDDFWM
jgi:hypothetical protein